jgi:hypothetical protein
MGRTPRTARPGTTSMWLPTARQPAPTGIRRNQTRFMLAAMAYNIKRGVAVQAEMMALAGQLRPMDAKRRTRAKDL